MRIQQVGYSQAAQRAKKKAGQSSDVSGFDDALATESPIEQTTASESTNSLSMDGFLALQEQISPDQQAKQQGHHVLDMLEELRLSILSGTLTFGQLKHLKHSMQQITTPLSPDLQSVMDDIKLRTRVEIAKLAKSSQIPL